MFRQPQLFLSILPRNSPSSFANNHTRRSSSVSLVSPIVANRKNSGSTILGGSALSSHFMLRCAPPSTASTASTDGVCTKRTFATTTTPTNTGNTHYANRRDMPFQHFSRGRRSNTIHYPPSPQSTIGTSIDGGQEEQEGVILPTQKFKIPRKRASKLFHELNVEKCEENRQRKPDVFQVPFRVGDAIEVTQVSSGGINSNEIEKIRGVVLGKRNRGLGSVFYLRDVLFGEPIERIIPLHSPMIQKIEILQHNFVKGKEGKKIKRAKLFYLRNRNPALCRVTKEA